MGHEHTIKRRKELFAALSDEAYRVSPGLASDAMFVDRYSLVRVANFLADHHPEVIGELIAACAATATEVES